MNECAKTFGNFVKNAALRPPPPFPSDKPRTGAFEPPRAARNTLWWSWLAPILGVFEDSSPLHCSTSAALTLPTPTHRQIPISSPALGDSVLPFIHPFNATVDPMFEVLNADHAPAIKTTLEKAEARGHECDRIDCLTSYSKDERARSIRSALLDGAAARRLHALLAATAWPLLPRSSSRSGDFCDRAAAIRSRSTTSSDGGPRPEVGGWVRGSTSDAAAPRVSYSRGSGVLRIAVAPWT